MSKRFVPKKSIRGKRLTAHAIGRGNARYSLEDHEMDKIRKEIQSYFNNSCKSNPDFPISVLKRQSGRRTVVAIKWNGDWIPVVFDKQRRVLVTILPENALNEFPSLDTVEEEFQEVPPRSDVDRWLAGEDL